MFCKHKFGEIKGGYQYCTKCNKAVLVPCSHIWDIINTYEVIRPFGNTRGKIYVLQCVDCGEITQRRIGLKED